MSFFDPLKLEYIDGRTWKVDAEFRYEAELRYENPTQRLVKAPIVVPAGTLTDFASIPRFFWRVLPPTGEYGKAAVVHDYLYQNIGRVGERELSREQCDLVFREAMRCLGVSPWKRQAMYQAVRMFGWKAWGDHKKRLTALYEQENPTRK